MSGSDCVRLRAEGNFFLDAEAVVASYAALDHWFVSGIALSCAFFALLSDLDLERVTIWLVRRRLLFTLLLLTRDLADIVRNIRVLMLILGELIEK